MSDKNHDRALRVLIADDEPRARQFLEKLLGEHAGVEVVGNARGGGEALEKIAALKPDVAFLDIHMPDLSGLEVARHLKGEAVPIVVFVTAYDQYAVEAFEVAALDYLLKPIRRERLAETLSRIAAEPRGARAAANQSAAIESALGQPGLRDQLRTLTRLPVRHRREVRLLDLEQVPLLFSRDRLVLARAEGKEYLVDYTLQELEQRLPEGRFVRVHRGALVNVEAIESYGGEDGVLVLRLKDGTRVEASERRAAEVRRKLR
ncbi:MAG: response regulator transcription factor [Candidatus Eisenbacteria bacterium]|nr:response regulator transcription factor [Candidatus Eisenbacteria bacterium]